MNLVGLDATYRPVMAGLVPAIPIRRARPFPRLLQTQCVHKRDGRVKPGHDDVGRTSQAIALRYSEQE